MRSLTSSVDTCEAARVIRCPIADLHSLPHTFYFIIPHRKGFGMSRVEASSAATNMTSTCGIWAVQESGILPCSEAIEHWVNRNVPAARMGREAALVIQATRAGRASRRRCLFRMGRNEVRTVAMSARKAAMIYLDTSLTL